MQARQFQVLLFSAAGIIVCSGGTAGADGADVATALPSTAARLNDAASAGHSVKAARASSESENTGTAAMVPTNNDCASAAPISGTGLFPFDNATATQDGPSHNSCNFFDQTQIDHDVWYCWTAPAQACTGNYVVETCGHTVVDTKIAFYDGCVCPPTDGGLLACDDDGCGGLSRQSRASFTAVPGHSYLIRIGTYPAESGGAGDFSISCNSTSVCTEPLNHCQTGDRLDAVNSNRVTFRVADGFTAATSGTLNSLCWWGAYLTPPPGLANCQGVVPDTFKIRYLMDLDGLPGTEIASFSQEIGTLVVSGPVPTGSLINGSTPEYEFHATHANTSITAGDCIWVEISNQMAGCNWYWETSQHGDGRAAHDGLPTPPPNGYSMDDIIVADMAFCVNLELQQGGTACLPPAPPNDSCANALPLTGEGTFVVDNGGASEDGPAYPTCQASGQAGIGRDVWYRWTSTCDGKVMLRTCDQTDVDTKVAVYPNAVCPTAQTPPLACNDDICGFQSMALFDAVSGHDYLLRVGTFPGAPGGALRFVVSCGPPANPACPGGGSCCEAGALGVGGCSDKGCCETVCACDPVCCDVEWDSFCAANGFGSSGCGAVDLCGCGSVCGRPDAGDCCVGHGTPGCNDTACCEAVCACDPACCNIEWDSLCAGTGFVLNCGAEVLCAAHCTPPPTCPSGAVAFGNPPSGIVDARQPSVPGIPSLRQGFQTFTVTAPPGAAASCWTPCETRIAGTPNTIASVVEAPAGTYTILLSRPISAGAVTTLTYTPSAGAATTGYFTSHPANVNSDSASAPVDILELIDHLNGVRLPPLVIWQCDIDRSNLCAPADILTEIDLLNGASGFAVWNGTPKPSAAGLCPQP